RVATQYFSYSAPAEEDQTLQSQAARQLAQAFQPAQQVVFIRSPETNLFTLTAKQLAARNALDIYVLQRQTDAATLQLQRAAIEQQLGQQPTVRFVKYRTPADANRALSSLRANYEQLPGRSISHALETANVIKLHSPSLNVVVPQANYEPQELETAQLQSLFRQYLPPAQER
ncbi:TwdlS, partial [Drosophila busckii]